MLEAGYGSDDRHFFQRQDVKAEIQQRRKLMEKRNNVDLDWIVERLKAIADVDITALLEQDEEGKWKPAALDKLAPALKKAMEVSIVNGRVKVTQNDRLKALDQLAKLLGLYEEKVKVEGELSLTDRLLQGRKRARLRGEEDNGEARQESEIPNAQDTKED